MLNSFRNNRKLVQSRGVPVYRDFYTMKIEAEISGPRHLWREFRFRGFHCSI